MTDLEENRTPIGDKDLVDVKDSSTEGKGESEKNPSPSVPTASSSVSVIAGHYNAMEDVGRSTRSKSRIFYMRNFNNWIKSVLIGNYLTLVQEKKKLGDAVKVLDLGCGKGGDLIKWKIGRITHLLCADVAEASVEHCRERYADMKSRNDGRRGYSKLYSAEFIHSDCTKERLRSKYKDPSIKLDLVSCQFAFHYCFESVQQADTMLQNAAENLSVGGYFIGTLPDANEIIKRLIKSGSKSFGNSIYNVSFECPTDPISSIPLFGAKYNFNLEDVVSCPEFLVHFPTFERLAERYGLKLVSKQSFGEVFQDNCKNSGYLLQKMQALETYPPMLDVDLVGNPDSDYDHAKSYLQQKSAEREQQRSTEREHQRSTEREHHRSTERIGTLSKEEWEATSLYLAFAFQKVR